MGGRRGAGVRLSLPGAGWERPHPAPPLSFFRLLPFSLPPFPFPSRATGRPQGAVVARPDRVQGPAVRLLPADRPQPPCVLFLLREERGGAVPRHPPLSLLPSHVFPLLFHPVSPTEDPLVGSIAQQLLADKDAHDKTAAEWTRRYAQG